MFATIRRNFTTLPNILFMDKLNSTVESNLRSPKLPDVFVRLTGAKERKEGSTCDDTILEAIVIAEGLPRKSTLS